jgi:hypothetical protein
MASDAEVEAYKLRQENKALRAERDALKAVVLKTGGRECPGLLDSGAPMVDTVLAMEPPVSAMREDLMKSAAEWAALTSSRFTRSIACSWRKPRPASYRKGEVSTVENFNGDVSVECTLRHSLFRDAQRGRRVLSVGIFEHTKKTAPRRRPQRASRGGSVVYRF